MGLMDIFSRGKKEKASRMVGKIRSGSTDMILNSRIDSEKARSIWYNTQKEYKLSSSIIICGIRTITDYVGIPQIRKNGLYKEVQAGLSDIAKDIHTKIFVEGNVFVWSNWNSEKNKIEHIMYNYEDMVNPVFDIDTKELLQVSFKHSFEFYDEYGNMKSTNRTKTFTKDKIITMYDGDVPVGQQRYEVITHNLGVLPVKMHTFNKFPNEVEGHGFIESAEPYLASLSEIILNRVIEDKRTSRKKLNITTKDPEDWINNTIKVNGLNPEAEVSIEDLDFLFNALGSDGTVGKTEYLVHGQSAQDSLQIAKWLQDSVYEVLTTPEFVFPEKLGASFASVTAQVPNWVHHIESIREILSKNWTDQVNLDSLIISKATGKRKSEVSIYWKRLDLETPELRAKIVQYMITSMATAQENMLMTPVEIRDYLDEYLNNLGDYTSLEKELPKMMEAVKNRQPKPIPTIEDKGDTEGNE